MDRGRASLLDVRGRAQFRTYHYPYTYTFYSIEHFLDEKGLDVRFSDIARGRIIAHFDEAVALVGGRRGFLDFTLETRGNNTSVRMLSSFYNRVNDPTLYVVREKILRRLQRWLDEERTMTLPTRPGDIPRFRDEFRGRMFIDRRTAVGPPDTSRLERYMAGLGGLIIISGLIIVPTMGIFPGWVLMLVLLSGLPFIWASVPLSEGRWELPVYVCSSLGLLAGLVYIVLTVFIGLIVILLPVAVIDETIWEIRTWERFRQELDGDGKSSSTPNGKLSGRGGTARWFPEWT